MRDGRSAFGAHARALHSLKFTRTPIPSSPGPRRILDGPYPLALRDRPPGGRERPIYAPAWADARSLPGPVVTSHNVYYGKSDKSIVPPETRTARTRSHWRRGGHWAPSGDAT